MNNKLLVIISVIFLVFIGSLSLVLYHNSIKNDISSNQLSNSLDSQSQDVSKDTVTSAATQEYVRYGQKVTSKEVDKAITSMNNNGSVTKEEVIDSIANSKLLVAKATENNIVVSDNDAQKFIDYSLNITGTSIQDYHDRLAAAGISEDEYKAQIKEQIMIAELINKTIKPEDYVVSDKEVDDFITAHMTDYQPIFDDNDTQLINYLKARIKTQMIESKKSALVIKYVKSLQSSS